MSGWPRSVLSDLVSEKINRIKDAIGDSALFEDKELVRKAIECCVPPVLVAKVGFAKILQRVPTTYLRALFASRLAGTYVYTHGLDANEVDFFGFLQEFKERD